MYTSDVKIDHIFHEISKNISLYKCLLPPLITAAKAILMSLLRRAWEGGGPLGEICWLALLTVTVENKMPVKHTVKLHVCPLT